MQGKHITMAHGSQFTTCDNWKITYVSFTFINNFCSNQFANYRKLQKQNQKAWSLLNMS